MPREASELAERLLRGDRRALARSLTHVENRSRTGLAILKAVYPHSGRAHTIGITGAPGAGKSTVSNELAKAFRRRGQSVGIVAVDPSSPFTQGAILGDRIRMQEVASDPEVFIRSLATRGALGGLSASALDVVQVLDAFGKAVVLIETVGAGQDEVEIVRVAQTTVLIDAPGMGDGVQTLKAGIMEIADILGVNKADRPGADTLVGQLHALLSLAPAAEWSPPIIKLVATEGRGIDELADACRRHRTHLEESGRLAGAERERARTQVLALARQKVLETLAAQSPGGPDLDALVEAIAARRLDPHSAADQLTRRHEHARS